MHNELKKYLNIIVSLVAIAFSVQSSSQELMPNAHYVNMGSSFAAASGVDPSEPSSGRCWRSKQGYASLLANKLSLNLEDRSCAGAKSYHLLEPWDELPPQIDAVNSDTRLVTITVGGNDLNYVGNLIAANCSQGEDVALQDKSIACPVWTLADDKAYTQLKDNLSKVVTQISVRAPAAKVILIQYLSLIPSKPCEATSLTETQSNQMRAVSQRLAAITSEVASEGGATILSADKLSMSHTACDSDPWTVGFKPTPENAEGILWHPNRQGNEEIADLLLKELDLKKMGIGK